MKTFAPPSMMPAIAFAILSFPLCESLTQGQEFTPARQLGQASAANPYDLAADGTARRKQRELAANSLAASAEPSSAAADVNAWWEGMEGVARASIRSSAWAMHYGLTTAWEYDDNFSLGRPTGLGSGAETQIVSVSPYGVLTYGEPGHGVDFQLRYSPEFRWFSDNTLSEVLNHNLSAVLGINGARSRVTLSAYYSRNEGGNIEVGDLVSVDLIGATLAGSYDVSPKTTIGGSFSLTSAVYDQFNSFNTILMGAYADYAVTPKTRLGIGVGYENTQQDRNLTANAYNLNLRLNWEATAKTGVSGSVGGEQREYDGGNSITAAIGRVGIYYNPTNKTSFQLSAYRSANPSIGVANGMYYGTGVALTGAFQVSDRVSTNIDLGFENAQYETTGGLGVSREDNYLFIRPSLNYIISAHLSMRLFYQFTNNDSSGAAASSFDRNQVGISLTLAY